MALVGAWTSPNQWPGLILSSSTTTPNEWSLVLLCHLSNANTSDDDRGIVQLFLHCNRKNSKHWKQPHIERHKTASAWSRRSAVCRCLPGGRKRPLQVRETSTRSCSETVRDEFSFSISVWPNIFAWFWSCASLWAPSSCKLSSHWPHDWQSCVLCLEQYSPV